MEPLTPVALSLTPVSEDTLLLGAVTPASVSLLSVSSASLVLTGACEGPVPLELGSSCCGDDQPDDPDNNSALAIYAIGGIDGTWAYVAATEQTVPLIEIAAETLTVNGDGEVEITVAGLYRVSVAGKYLPGEEENVEEASIRFGVETNMPVTMASTDEVKTPYVTSWFDLGLDEIGPLGGPNTYHHFADSMLLPIYPDDLSDAGMTVTVALTATASFDFTLERPRIDVNRIRRLS